MHFPAAKVTLTIEGKSYDIAVGVSEHLTVDMLMDMMSPILRNT